MLEMYHRNVDYFFNSRRNPGHNNKYDFWAFLVWFARNTPDPEPYLPIVLLFTFFNFTQKRYKKVLMAAREVYKQ